jgi:polysaccharide deacetylase 2 family uncharacterized protein YibQ
VSYAAIIAGFALIIALLVIMAVAAWYFIRPAPPKPPRLDADRIAKALARQAEARLSMPPLDDRGELIGSGKRRDSTGHVYYIIWAGYSDTGLVLAEKAVEDAWREIGGDIRVGILYPDHPRAGERVLMVAGVSEKPLVELSLKLDQKLGKARPNARPQGTEPAKGPALRHKTPSGKMAVIIDDIGNNLDVVESLLAIPVPITLSVLPNADYSEQVCDKLRTARAEVMLHMPMEPQSYPENDPGDGALLVGMFPREIRKSLKDALESVPLAVGMNNHMGSAFTTDRKAMRALMKVVKERDLYFIDSRTHHRTVAYIAAQEAGVPSAERRVFLDHSQDPAHIRSQLELLAETAEQEGVAIGIGHPYPETIEVLAGELPKMSERGCRFVFASEAVR